MKMKCEQCGTIVNVKSGKDLICDKCGCKTTDAIYPDTYGVNKPIGEQWLNHNERFFNPK